VQCKLHGGEKLPQEEADRLKARQKELLEAWKKVWMKPFKGLFANYEFKRGFVERATMKARTFLDHGDRILSLTPMRLPKLRDPVDHFEELAGCQTLERLWGLNLNFGHLGAKRSEEFLTSPRLKSLRWFDFGNNNIGLAGTRALVKAKLDGLRFLALDSDKLGDAGLEHLAESQLLGQIEALNLDGNRLTDAGLQALADSPHAGRLAQLHVASNHDLTVAGIESLVTSPRLSALRWVCLDCWSAMKEGLDRLRKKYGERVVLTNEGSQGSLEAGPVAKL
jgi:hypothetical protein